MRSTKKYEKELETISKRLDKIKKYQETKKSLNNNKVLSKKPVYAELKFVKFLIISELCFLF